MCRQDIYNELKHCADAEERVALAKKKGVPDDQCVVWRANKDDPEELAKQVYKVEYAKAGGTTKDFDLITNVSGPEEYRIKVAQDIQKNLGGQCDIRALVSNHKTSHPRVSAVMNRLLKKAQRIGCDLKPIVFDKSRTVLTYLCAVLTYLWSIVVVQVILRSHSVA